MSFRARLIISFVLVALLPVVGLALLVRSEMTSRLTAQYEGRIDALIEDAREELVRMDLGLAARLSALGRSIIDDNRFRLAVEQPGEDRSFLLDYAETAMRLNGLSVLQILDEEGRIVSSGHFRNEFDRLDAALVARLHDARTRSNLPPVVAMRAPERWLYVAARVDTLAIGTRMFFLVAGEDLREEFLPETATGASLDLFVVLPGAGVLRAGADDESIASERPSAGSGALEREIELTYVDSDRDLQTATVVARHHLGELAVLLRRVDSFILVILLAAAVLAAVLVTWNASRLSRPLAELTRKASRIDLDRLDADFSSDRTDEIGRLSRVLGTMSSRLRSSAVSLREAERQAALGDLSRQVNHDVKNGLTPVRNIMRHLAELSRDDPGSLPAVFRERLPALESGIEYLENLSSNYGRLSRQAPRTACDVGSVARRVAEDYRAGRSIRIHAEIKPSQPVLADPVALRRILENLVDNAVDSFEGETGTVMVSTEPVAGEDGLPLVRITVADDGRGMTGEQRGRIFENFFTTKEQGTGLGLSIVRRLVVDLGGSISVQSEPGAGSRFTIDLPASTAHKSQADG